MLALDEVASLAQRVFIRPIGTGKDELDGFPADRYPLDAVSNISAHALAAPLDERQLGSGGRYSRELAENVEAFPDHADRAALVGRHSAGRGMIGRDPDRLAMGPADSVAEKAAAG